MTKSGSKYEPHLLYQYREIETPPKWRWEQGTWLTKIELDLICFPAFLWFVYLHSFCFRCFLIVVFCVQPMMENDRRYTLQSSHDRRNEGASLNIVITVHTILHSLHSCNSSRICCFISCSCYFIHHFILLWHAVGFLCRTMSILFKIK